jgi:hypothetical protein
MDNVPIKFLKMVLPHIVDIITHIFNTILITSNYPATWKTSKITPIAKPYRPCGLADYCLISVLPALSKALEIIMKSQIIDNLMMSCYQSGFRA